MSTTNPRIALFLNLARAHAVRTRSFDNGLGGLGLTEYTILLELSQADDETMRRIDLAQAVGLTASGVTRLLLPMEKIGLVKRVADTDDARVSRVRIATGGRRKLTEATERMELLSEELLEGISPTHIEMYRDFLAHLAAL